MDEMTNFNMHRNHLLRLAKRWASKHSRSTMPAKTMDIAWRVQSWLDDHSDSAPDADMDFRDNYLTTDVQWRFAGASLVEPVSIPGHVRNGTSTQTYELYGYGSVASTGSASTEYQMGGGVIERFEAYAFAESLKKRNQRFLWSHNPDFVLGSVAADTLRLHEDSIGLAFTVSLPPGALPDYFGECVARGDVTGASVGFIISDGDVEFESDGQNLVATIHSAELLEVSTVAWPAYSATVCKARIVDESARSLPDRFSTRGDGADWTELAEFFRDAGENSDENGFTYLENMERWCNVELAKVNRQIARSGAPLRPPW